MTQRDDEMKKIKLFIYPFIFSVIFFIVYVTLTYIITSAFPFPYSSNCCPPGAWESLFTAVVMPIFCLIYGIIISKDKFKYLFVIYNSVVLFVCHLLLLHHNVFSLTFLFIFILWTAFWTIIPCICKKSKDENKDENTCDNNANKKKYIIVLSSLIIVVALIVSSIFVFKHYYPTHYPYDDDFIIGRTEEQIIEKYGEFDRQSGLYKPDTVYLKSYLIHKASGDILFGSDYNTWYEISFKNGIAVSVRLRTVDKAA